MNYSKYIDHTVLKATATADDVKKLIDEAICYDFKSVCIEPCFVNLAASLLRNTNILVCTVVGFPLGLNTIETKVFETIDAIKNGADEIDYVVNIAKVKSHDYNYIEDEMKQLKKATEGKTLKVILETCYLTEEEIIMLCKIASRVKVDFVKTSTGFGTAGATLENIKLMRQHCDKNVEIKASGGVKTHDFMVELIKAGATRIGASNSILLMGGNKNEQN